jgi:hypothetical protein
VSTALLTNYLLGDLIMTTLTIADVQHTEKLTRSTMARIVGGDTKQPVGKPTHIDAMKGELTFKDGSVWTMDLSGNLTPK